MIKSELVIFTTYIFFANKITTTGSSAFQKKYNDWIRPPLVIFLSIFEKNCNDWIKGKLPKSRYTYKNQVPIIGKTYYR